MQRLLIHGAVTSSICIPNRSLTFAWLTPKRLILSKHSISKKFSTSIPSYYSPKHLVHSNFSSEKTTVNDIDYKYGDRDITDYLKYVGYLELGLDEKIHYFESGDYNKFKYIGTKESFVQFMNYVRKNYKDEEFKYDGYFNMQKICAEWRKTKNN